MGDIFPEGVSGDNAEHVEAVGKLVFLEILSVVLQLLSIVFNGAIICTLCRRSLLKYPSNRFVFSLCLSHLVVSFLSVSISLLTTLVPSQPSSVYRSSHDLVNQPQLEASLPSAQHSPVPVQCTANSRVDLAHLIMMHINFGVAVCTSITVALISAERYITIARPMRYKSIVTARRSLCAIICCWLLAALITMMPLLLFENRNPECGTYSVPMESLATYFGIVFTVVTIFALAVMIVCYSHIFRIAKAKCQKVQIGHFTASTVSSISSDWPSSAYSSVQGQHRFLHAGSRIESSNSLLHWVLMTNLGRHNPLRLPHGHRRGVPVTPPATPTLPPKNAFFSESALNNRRESDETTTTGASSGNSSRNGSTSSSTSGGGGGTANSKYFIDPSRSPFQYHHLPHRKLRNRWKTYLQPNYNSPRKTIFTIMLLIGAVLFTQLPLSFVLFTSTVETTQRWFQFCITVLFSTSSVANPVLYGFLNRSIRDQLWRLLKRKGHGAEHGPSASSIRKRKRGQQQLEEMAQTSKNILTSASQNHLQNLCRDRKVEVPAIKISRKESISSDDNSVTSTNSVNIIGNTSTASSAKAKINQVQKRIASSPYYRTVLLKKANNNKSLLPRLTLPDVNVRRNSSGSIISIHTNGVMSKKAKVKEDNEWNEPTTNKYDGNGATSQPQQISVEMQTFHNYSTPDLPSSSPSAVVSTRVDSKLRVHVEEDISHSSNNSDNIEIRSQNNTQGQVPLPQENDTQNLSLETGSEQRQENSCHYKNFTTAHEATVSSAVSMSEQLDRGNDNKPGPSHMSSGSDQESPAEKLEMCLSVESLMGVVIDEEVLPENFPRKPSQDSGADMAFSDEEDEPLPINPGAHECNRIPLPIMISTSALSSLPLAIKGKASSATSLVGPGPFLLIGHHDTAGNFRSLSNITQPTDILFLPCSCAAKPEDNPHQANENSRNKVDNGVTVTITDSNSDTELFNPHLFSSNQNLFHANNNACPSPHRNHTHILHHDPHCAKGIALKAFKSKSESDICRGDEGHVINCSNFEDGDLKIRSNCHINLVVDKNSSHNNHKVKEGISPSSCAVWVNDGQLPLWNSSGSQQYLLRAATAPVSIPSSHNQSQQWLSVMSVHSSCSSLSSTCPLRILEGYNKSDVSDYDDFEDHIEI
ncbi:unnamed protein product [Orchesella dallaii]|uniref:G-protein coupled receptors family 1 profile domain-containing protein n=1 Tax=Orchesella dallaii TaxID=48710 RepID=A0ABP1S2E1_9HEXA